MSVESIERSAGVLAAIDHLGLLVDQQTRLKDEIHDAVKAVATEIRRVKWTPREAVNWWKWAYAAQVPWATTYVSDALGISVSTLRSWQHFPPGERYTIRGTFPLGKQLTPCNGFPCVYRLLGQDSRCLYVGKSINIRGRLQAHWQTRRPLIKDWEVLACLSEPEAVELESELISKHQPLFNTVGIEDVPSDAELAEAAFSAFMEIRKSTHGTGAEDGTLEPGEPDARVG